MKIALVGLMLLASLNIGAGSMTVQKHCMLVSVTAEDTKNALKTLMTDVDSKLIGREPDENGAFAYYVLGFQNVACTILNLKGEPEEVFAEVTIGVNPDVPNAVRVELVKQNAAYRQVGYGTPRTREAIIEDLRLEALNNGCSKIWHMKPGDNISVTSPENLLTKFVNP